MKKLLAFCAAFMLVSCSSPKVTPGEAYKLYPGLIQLYMDGAQYSCHAMNEAQSMTLMCRKNPQRS